MVPMVPMDPKVHLMDTMKDRMDRMDQKVPTTVRTDSMENVKKDTVPFWPFYVIKDVFALMVVLIFLIETGIVAMLFQFFSGYRNFEVGVVHLRAQGGDGTLDAPLSLLFREGLLIGLVFDVHPGDADSDQRDDGGSDRDHATPAETRTRTDDARAVVSGAAEHFQRVDPGAL